MNVIENLGRLWITRFHKIKNAHLQFFKLCFKLFSCFIRTLLENYFHERLRFCFGYFFKFDLYEAIVILIGWTYCNFDIAFKGSIITFRLSTRSSSVILLSELNSFSYLINSLQNLIFSFPNIMFQWIIQWFKEFSKLRKGE